MNTADTRVEWAKLLSAALAEPGRIHEAYQRFNGYSLSNRIWALMQCLMRGISPGPLASFNRWKTLGRRVKKGERAIALCMPVSGKRKSTDGEEEIDTIIYQRFIIKNHWFVFSQTEGDEYTPEPLSDWNEANALEALKISKVPFEIMDGNAQGYAAPGRKISVNPIAVLPYKTLFHELGHILLGHVEADALRDAEEVDRNIMEVEAESVSMLCCASLNLPGVEYSRGYIQSWAHGQPISDKSARRIFGAADQILKAGLAVADAHL